MSVEHINADLPALASIGGVDDQRLAQVSSHVNGRCHVLCTLVNLPPHAGVVTLHFRSRSGLEMHIGKKMTHVCMFCFWCVSLYV